jgi:hypothetical protein
MELIQVANYLSGRYLISNLKKDKKSLLTGTLLASCSVDSLGASKQEVYYYDTQDFFFADKGINIYIVQDKTSRELIIRYDSEQVQRIDFLKNTPNFFKVKIEGKNMSILSYANQINDAIYRVFPEGLHVNIEDMLRISSPQIKIMKKFDSYRVVNNIGLKSTISFTDATYFKMSGMKTKFSETTLEVTGEASNSREKFDEFLKKLVLDCPQFIRLTNNELSFARKNLN